MICAAVLYAVFGAILGGTVVVVGAGCGHPWWCVAVLSTSVAAMWPVALVVGAVLARSKRYRDWVLRDESGEDIAPPEHPGQTG